MKVFLDAFDALTQADPHIDRAAVFLVENAIAAGQHDSVLSRLDVLRSVASAASSDESVRIRMCLADVDGQWDDLLWEIQRRHEPRIRAWARARYARHLALSGNGQRAEATYLQAIEQASAMEMFDEAADWLYALRTVRWLYSDRLPNEHPDEHSLALALRPHAKPSTLPGSPHTAELALEAMLDDSNGGEALLRVQRWQWQAFVRAGLADERQAVKALGTLLEKQGDVDGAIKSYVRAGDRKRASSAAGALPDSPADVESSLLTGVRPSRSAAFAAAAAAADLLSDDEALLWINEAIAEITNGDDPYPITQGFPAQRAFDVLASMCQVMPPEQADTLLQLLEPIVDRPDIVAFAANKATARILLELSSRPSTPSLLARAIVGDERMADIILNRPDVLKAHRNVLVDRLTPLARDNRDACLAIIRSGANPAATLELARAEVEQVLAPRAHSPGVYNFYGAAADDAILASVLDQGTRNRFAVTMLTRALDQSQPKPNRWNDLAGLFNIAPAIDQLTRDQVLAGVMEIAQGKHVGEGLLSFDVDVDLATIALQCAATLGPDADTCREIEQLALTHLRAADESKQWGVSQALVLLPAENSQLDLVHCAVHPSAPVRALAAIRWANNPAVLPYKRAQELARDSDFEVRREFAKALRSKGVPIADETREIIAILRQDVRRSVRTPALQAEAHLRSF
jgi:tetratricopeptide (TPR) repeat protein